MITMSSTIRKHYCFSGHFRPVNKSMVNSNIVTYNITLNLGLLFPFICHFRLAMLSVSSSMQEGLTAEEIAKNQPEEAARMQVDSYSADNKLNVV